MCTTWMKREFNLVGVRNLDGTQYLFAQDQQNCVRTQSANLELVMTIECVVANGSSLKPCFMFTGKNVPHKGYFKEDSIL